MKNINNNPLQKRQGEDTEKNRKTQRNRIFLELFKRPLNTKELHLLTAIPREGICRRKRDLENEGLLRVIKMDYCPITGRLVQVLSANPQEWKKHLKK